MARTRVASNLPQLTVRGRSSGRRDGDHTHGGGLLFACALRLAPRATCGVKHFADDSHEPGAGAVPAT